MNCSKIISIYIVRLILVLMLFACRSLPARADKIRQPAAPTNAYVRLEITPSQVLLDGAQARQQLLVTGVRGDGSLVDVTEAAQFVSSAPGTVKIGKEGVAHPGADALGDQFVAGDVGIGIVRPLALLYRQAHGH